jgi:hydroxymethylpyrimidine/phosphomethylpyrimidine kinase
VLAKGGHAGGVEVVDLLVAPDGVVHRFRHPRLETSSTHGTGCTLSSAIAARLARGEGLAESVGGAVNWLHEAMKAAYPLGSGHGPVDHLHGLFGREEDEA